MRPNKANAADCPSKALRRWGVACSSVSNWSKLRWRKCIFIGGVFCVVPRRMASVLRAAADW